MQVMTVGLNPNISNNQCKKQNPAFGSFPMPKTRVEAFNLRDQATFKELLPTPDNIESLKSAYNQSQAGSAIQSFLEDIAYKWKLKLD